MMKRFMGIDLGEKNIGVSISDPMGISARPLTVLRHVQREQDAEQIAALARQEDVGIIVVGQALGPNGEATGASRHATKVADAIRAAFPEGEVLLWDESGSTQAAKRLMIEMGVSRKARRGHLDDRAAATILQDYLNWLYETGGGSRTEEENHDPNG